MIEFVAYLAAQEQTLAHARGAWPDAPVRSDSVVTRVVRPNPLRQQMSAALRRLADTIEPKPECTAPAISPC